MCTSVPAGKASTSSISLAGHCIAIYYIYIKEKFFFFKVNKYIFICKNNCVAAAASGPRELSPGRVAQ